MKCDKCGCEVHPENDATILEAIISGNIAGMLFYGARHLLPEGSCLGSPSRAQYLPGQPRDTREDYPYNPEYEKIYREAYQKLVSGEWKKG